MRPSPREMAESARRLRRRALLLGGVQLGAAAALGLRMHRLQVVEAGEYRTLAEENRINVRLIPPQRGVIFDRAGRALAVNRQTHRVVIVREDAGDVENVLARLARLIELEPARIAEVLETVHRRSPFVPVTVADRLSWQELARIAVNAPALPGVTPEVGLSRAYPFGADFAHVVGYVGPVSEADLERRTDPDPVLEIPDFQIGKTGVEAKLDSRLRGRAGSRRIEVNASGRVIREIGRIPGQAGADIQLTTDAKLQNFLLARLGTEKSASAVVLDLVEGDILAVGASPAFEPAKFVNGISRRDYSALIDSPYRPLRNKAVQGVYPPGSTVKTIAALAALEAGLVTPEEMVWCPGYVDVGNRRFHCWKRGGHGHVALNASIAQSCDVYYYEMAQRVGIDRLAAMARRFGLGEEFELPLSAVAGGLYPDRAWKRARRGAEWLVGDTLNAIIGQGFVLASPLQLAVMTARLATGRALNPRLVKSVNGVARPSGAGGPLDVSEESLALVRGGMDAVMNGRRGTGRGSRVELAGARLAGKSGTSQVRGITAEQRAEGLPDNDEVLWKQRDHALFVGYAPAEAPRVAVSVVVEHGGGGSSVAAPIMRDLALFALEGDVPTLAAYPAHQRDEMARLLEGLSLREFGPDATPGRSRA